MSRANFSSGLRVLELITLLIWSWTLMSSSALSLKRLETGSSMSSKSMAKFFFSTRIRSVAPKC